ncbi:MAG: S1C family serine protease [Alphaproteobacteria bacterium]
MALEDTVLAFVGPVDAPMQPRDEACASLADASGRNLLNSRWRACSVSHFAEYDAKRAEYRACLEEEARLGQARVAVMRQIVALDRQLRQSALGGIPERPPVPGWLGVEIDDLEPIEAARLRLDGVPGAFVEGTLNRSPAQRAGLREGDLITAVEGTPIGSAQELQTYAQRLVAGQTIAVDIIRAGMRRTVYVAIEARR